MWRNSKFDCGRSEIGRNCGPVRQHRRLWLIDRFATFTGRCRSRLDPARFARATAKPYKPLTGRSRFDFPDGNNLFCLCVLARSGIAFKMRQNNRQNRRRASLRVRAANAKSGGPGDFNNERPAWGGKEAGCKVLANLAPLARMRPATSVAAHGECRGRRIAAGRLRKRLQILQEQRMGE